MTIKLTVFILVATFNVTAGGYTQTVTLHRKNAPLIEIFKEIRQQTRYDFLYQVTWLDKAKPVNIDIKNIPLTDALDLIFDNQPVTYSITGTTIVLRLKKQNIEIANPTGDFIDVKGRVLNEKGEPVEGVSVTIKGTSTSTKTNTNGEFRLASIEQDAVLIFSHVSMETFELKVSGKTELTVTLKTKISTLGEVSVQVNTGYQDISGERFTGSYSKLDSQSFHRRAGMGIIERLDGTVPGILFSKKGSSLDFPTQVRGISTLGRYTTSTSPLIVLDQFPMDERFDINSINPNDVESITLLKDAAAASIWGTRAGNGVIVVTTKKGRYNQRFNIAISSNLTIEEKPDLFYFPRISTSDFIDIETFLFGKNYYNSLLNDNYSRPVISPVVEILNRKKAGLISTADADQQINAFRGLDIRNDLNNYIFREAIRQQHYLSFSGGSNNLSYQFSMGFNQSLNNIKNSKADNQYTLSTSTLFRPFKNLEIQTGLNLTQGIVNRYNFTMPTYMFPYIRLADENGVPLSIPYGYRTNYLDTVGGGKLLDWNYRPLEEIKLADNNITNRFSVFKIGATFKPLNWLTASVLYQYSNNNSDARNYLSQEAWQVRNLINLYTNFKTSNPNLQYPIPMGGFLDLSNILSTRHDVRATLNFSKNWGQQHQIAAMVASELSEAKGYGNSERLYGFSDLTGTFRSNIDYFNTTYPLSFIYPGSMAAIPSSNFYSDQPFNRFVSYLGNVSYTFARKYNIYASARRDGANIFGVNTNNRWKPLWSAGGSWEISKERFYKINWISSLRLRLSYGYTGNVNNQLSGKPWITYDIPAQFTNLPNAYLGAAPNPDLKWEQVRIVNMGVDFSILNKLLSGTFEVFNKKSTNVIAALPLDPTVGVSTFPVNYAAMKSNGFEFTLGSKNMQGPVEWTTNLGISYAKTIITEVYNTVGYRAQDFIQYNINATPGQIAFGISSYRWAGLDPITGDPLGYLKGTESKDYAAIANDSIQYQIFHGSQVPLYSSFLTNTFYWKGFTLSANITGRFKYYFRQPSLNLDYAVQMDADNYLPDYYNRWQKPGDEAFTNVPSMIYPVPSSVTGRTGFYKYAEIHVKRGDNIRLQDIRLAYQWNRNHNRKIPFSSVQFYIYLNNLNLILWRADNSYFDPDFSGVSSNPTAAPIPNTWTGGITINF